MKEENVVNSNAVEPLYFVDAKITENDLPRWFRSPRKTTHEIYEILYSMFFGEGVEIKELRINSETELDLITKNGVTRRTELFGNFYQRAHETKTDIEKRAA